MAYSTGFGSVPESLGAIRQGSLRHPGEQVEPSGRTLLKGGRVVDPVNGIEDEMDVALRGPRIEEGGDGLRLGLGDRVYDVRGLQVWPGLIACTYTSATSSRRVRVQADAIHPRHIGDEGTNRARV